MDTGAIKQRLEYDSYGNVLSDSNKGFQPFGYAGGLHDGDTGLTKFGFRDYDQLTGRFTTKDPIGLNGGVNVYLYAMGNPVMLVDRMGLGPIIGNQKIGIITFSRTDPKDRKMIGAIDQSRFDKIYHPETDEGFVNAISITPNGSTISIFGHGGRGSVTMEPDGGGIDVFPSTFDGLDLNHDKSTVNFFTCNFAEDSPHSSHNEAMINLLEWSKAMGGPTESGYTGSVRYHTGGFYTWITSHPIYGKGDLILYDPNNKR